MEKRLATSTAIQKLIIFQKFIGELTAKFQWNNNISLENSLLTSQELNLHVLSNLNRLKFLNKQSCKVKNCKFSFGRARQFSPLYISVGTTFSSQMTSSVGYKGMLFNSSSWDIRRSWRDIWNKISINIELSGARNDGIDGLTDHFN